MYFYETKLIIKAKELLNEAWGLAADNIYKGIEECTERALEEGAIMEHAIYLAVAPIAVDAYSFARQYVLEEQTKEESKHITEMSEEELEILEDRVLDNAQALLTASSDERLIEKTHPRYFSHHIKHLYNLTEKLDEEIESIIRDCTDDYDDVYYCYRDYDRNTHSYYDSASGSWIEGSQEEAEVYEYIEANTEPLLKFGKVMGGSTN